MRAFVLGILLFCVSPFLAARQTSLTQPKALAGPDRVLEVEFTRTADKSGTSVWLSVRAWRMVGNRTQNVLALSRLLGPTEPAPVITPTNSGKATAKELCGDGERHGHDAVAIATAWEARVEQPASATVLIFYGIAKDANPATCGLSKADQQDGYRLDADTCKKLYQFLHDGDPAKLEVRVSIK